MTVQKKAGKKGRGAMGKLVYRMCLFAILVIAIAGGVYYYMTIYQNEETMDKGTFVENMDSAVQMADNDVAGPAMGTAQGRY